MALLRLEAINEENPSKTILQVDVTGGDHKLDNQAPRVYVRPLKPFWWDMHVEEKRKTQQKIAEQFIAKGDQSQKQQQPSSTPSSQQGGPKWVNL